MNGPVIDRPRLIERAFPLKQASLDSVHEKNVRHGHISTLHIWPARRPLAACRAALIATLLPDPGNPEERRKLCEKIGGKVVQKTVKKKMPNGRTVERIKEETEGGILHWKRETENAETLEWFRQEIRKAYGGRAPRVLDPFAGGGAIPLEAMRLGCEATAVDINPVAWFILKCTLEYPQKLAGKTHPLPDFILEDEEFMAAFYKAHPHLVGKTKRTKKQAKEFQNDLFMKDKSDSGRAPEVDLAWHVRAWGKWVLNRARRELAKFYPTYADFEPLKPGNAYEKQPMRLVPLKDDGTADVDALNAEFSAEYLADKRNPRWVAKPTVAYLWARTVTCKNCRATVPLLKTRWLCKKERKRVLLTMNVADAVNVDAASRRVIDAPSDETSLLRFFAPQEGIANMSGNLPHWRQEGVIYFVTFRLADSMPQEKLKRWAEERKEWLKNHPEPHNPETIREYYRLFPDRLEQWLDAGYGECLMAKPEVKIVVEKALRHFDGHRYRMDQFIVMPNHVHVLITPLEDNALSGIIHSWKSYTAHEINKLLGRQGGVWQKESFDHIIRSPAQLERVREYIKNNPRVDAASRRVNTTTTRRDGASTVVDAASRRVNTTTTRRDGASTVFGIENDVHVKGGNGAQRREHDKRIGAGTMSRAGVQCPCCNTIMTMEDIRLEGRAGRLGAVMTAVVVDDQKGKEYRLPAEHEIQMAEEATKAISDLFAQISFGLPEEPTPKSGGGASRAFSVDGYGFDKWKKLFTPRQLLALGTFVKWTRAACAALQVGTYRHEWGEAIYMGLTVGVDRIADRQSTVCRWDMGKTNLQGTFTRFALPITWDYCEGNPLSDTTGNYLANLEWVAEYWDHAMLASYGAPQPHAKQCSAIARQEATFDLVVTDPPYYDAIPYSDLMDFFYVWLRRTMNGLSPELDSAFHKPLSPKWDHHQNDGELIDDASRHEGDKAKSKAVYEHGMERAFQACAAALKPDGKMVVVFANKQPDAWETLVSAIIRAGFTVDGSWPIQTEMGNRTRALSSAALASSVWLVCKKRPATARPGWDNKVMEEMRANIAMRLREFWDAGIRGPDFVWAATGPALEAYSKHPVVKKANDPGKTMEVGEFLSHVRRMVVDFVVGHVLTGDRDGADLAVADRMDAPTAYYLLHRHDFGLGEAPSGACILYATACGLSDRELETTWDILVRTGGRGNGAPEEDDENGDADPDAEADPDSASGSGSKVKLKTWAQRKHKSMGHEAPRGQPVPLIDRIHRLMHLWRAGDVLRVDDYLDEHGLRRQELFRRLLQSLIELSPAGSDERTLLESLSNHVQAKGATPEDRQAKLAFVEEE